MPYERIAFIASDTPAAHAARERLAARYGDADPAAADVIVALGGDGLMLQTLHAHIRSHLPIYGMHRGTVGFLMNDYAEDGLRERLAVASCDVIHPLLMRAEAGSVCHEALAINEVSMFRQTYQAARLSIAVDDEVRLADLVGDGIVVATPAGSTAYNLSLQGPVLPITAALLAMTPISPFRPRRWRGAVLSSAARITITVQESAKRPVSAVADHTEFRDVERVEIAEARHISLQLLFDKGHALADRIIAEQFRY